MGVLKNKGESKREEACLDAPGVWVVVVAKPQQERLARLNLEQQGFEPYLPMRLSFNIPRQELVAAPYLPGYLFARTSVLASDWSRIWYTRGVHGVLGSADRPIGVTDTLIERLRAQEEGGFIKVGLQTDRPRFVAGERVRLVDSGVADGLEAVFVEMVDKKRAALLVSLLGRDSRLTVDLRKLRAASGS